MKLMYLYYLLSKYLALPVGALLRRYWGGWLHPENWLRKVLMVVVATLVAYGVTASPVATVALVAAVVFGFWFPQGHGRTMDMGYGNPNGTLPVGMCVTNFMGNYTTPMQYSGLIWFLVTGDYAGLFYAFLGLLAPVGHLVAQWLPDSVNKDPTKGYFIDSKTAVGELWLGAVLIGSMGLAAMLRDCVVYLAVM